MDGWSALASAPLNWGPRSRPGPALPGSVWGASHSTLDSPRPVLLLKDAWSLKISSKPPASWAEGRSWEPWGARAVVPLGQPQTLLWVFAGLGARSGWGWGAPGVRVRMWQVHHGASRNRAPLSADSRHPLSFAAVLGVL